MVEIELFGESVHAFFDFQNRLDLLADTQNIGLQFLDLVVVVLVV